MPGIANHILQAGTVDAAVVEHPVKRRPLGAEYWRAWLREPIVHFAVAGGLIFLAYSIGSRGPASETILVTTELIQGQIQARQDLLGRAVSDRERSDLIRSQINDEILIREAYARGLDKQDRIVRQRLLEIMRFVLGEEPAEPSQADLRSFLEAHRAAYEIPEAVTFSHVFFPKGGKGRPSQDLLTRLKRGEDFTKFGDSFWLGSTVEHYPEPDLAGVLGNQFVGVLHSLPLHEWSGPIESARGLHVLRIDARDPAHLPPFAALAPTLRSDWLSWRRAELLDHKIDELRKHYRVQMKIGSQR